jgi:hypothetical protein
MPQLRGNEPILGLNTNIPKNIGYEFHTLIHYRYKVILVEI